MTLHRSVRDEQRRADLLVGQPAPDLHQYLDLTVGQPFDLSRQIARLPGSFSEGRLVKRLMPDGDFVQRPVEFG